MYPMIFRLCTFDFYACLYFERCGALFCLMRHAYFRNIKIERTINIVIEKKTQVRFRFAHVTCNVLCICVVYTISLGILKPTQKKSRI